MKTEIPRKVDVDWLLCIYGALLTDKQREIASLYYEEDFSLAEIAQQEGISRQSVHDTLQRVEKQLLHLEEKLGVRGRLTQVEDCLHLALEQLQSNDAAYEHIKRALRLLTDEEDANGL